MTPLVSRVDKAIAFVFFVYKPVSRRLLSRAVNVGRSVGLIDDWEMVFRGYTPGVLGHVGVLVEQAL